MDRYYQRMNWLQEKNLSTLFFDSKKLPSAVQLLVPGFKDFSIVNQDFKLDLYHTVEENIRESILFLPTKQREKRVLQLLKLFELTKIHALKSNLISGIRYILYIKICI